MMLSQAILGVLPVMITASDKGLFSVRRNLDSSVMSDILVVPDKYELGQSNVYIE